MSKKDTGNIPSKVIEILQRNNIGYLSVTSPKGNLYTYPVAFFFSGQNVYFFTPAGSAKYRFIKANPKVSMVIDNRKLTQDACGAMIQGDATIFSIKQLFTSIISVAGTTMHFSKKYPGMFTFYAKGKELPDERKFYKYRFIRINPTKILYWVGYKFGRYFPKKATGRLKRLFADMKKDQTKSESALEAIAEMLESYDEEPVQEEPFSMDEPWLKRLNQATSKGKVTDEERKIIQLFTKSTSMNDAKLAYTQPGRKVSDEEKAILKKWRNSNHDMQK